jgi:hypothetical protein
MTPEDNKLLVQRFVDEAINRKNLDAIDNLVAENFVEHVPFPDQGPWRDGLVKRPRGFGRISGKLLSLSVSAYCIPLLLR